MNGAEQIGISNSITIYIFRNHNVQFYFYLFNRCDYVPKLQLLQPLQIKLFKSLNYVGKKKKINNNRVQQNKLFQSLEILSKA